MCPIGWFRRRFSVVTRLRRAGSPAGPCISGMFPSAGSVFRECFRQLAASGEIAWVSSAPLARTTTQQRMKLVIQTFHVYNRQSPDRWRPGSGNQLFGRPRRGVFAGLLSGPGEPADSGRVGSAGVAAAGSAGATAAGATAAGATAAGATAAGATAAPGGAPRAGPWPRALAPPWRGQGPGLWAAVNVR